jgi:predicted RNase H-like nuclease (RuvC/YqgF family)
MCVDSAGNREYKNTGSVARCKKVDLPGVTTIPTAMPKRQQAAVKSPSDFPRVDDATQKARDNDRKQILMDEMKAEQQRLAALRAEYNNGQPDRLGDERNYAKYQDRTASLKDSISRSEKNLEALDRELSNLK